MSNFPREVVEAPSTESLLSFTGLEIPTMATQIYYNLINSDPLHGFWCQIMGDLKPSMKEVEFATIIKVPALE